MVWLGSSGKRAACAARERLRVGRWSAPFRLVTGGCLAIALPLLVAFTQPAENAGFRMMPFVIAVLVATLVGGYVPGTLAVLVCVPLLPSAGAHDVAWEAMFAAVALVAPLMHRSRARSIRAAVEQAARLRHSEHVYRTLAERLPIGIFIDEPDSTCANIYSNPRIIEMLGYELRQWVGVPDFFASILHPEDRDRVLDSFRDFLEAEVPYHDEYRVITADGRVVWIWEECELVLDENGDRLHVQGVLIDITSRKEAEERAHETLQKYRSLVEHLPLVTYIEDAADRGRTLFVSPQMERLLGYPCERWVSEYDFFLQVLHPDDHPAFEQTRSESVPDVTSNTFRVVSKDGATHWIRSDRVLVRDDSGAPLYVQGFWVDMSEQRRLEEELRQRDRVEAVGRLAGGVAHDFNNLLMVVQAYAEIAQQQLAAGSDAHGSIEQIAKAAIRGGELTQQLLAYSRQQPSTPRAVDLNTAVREAEGLIARLIVETILVETRLEPELKAVHVDPVQLQQILVNLAVNARDAMPSGGTLSIRTAGAGDSVVLTVSDTGCGMDEETKRRAFDPFFTTKPVGRGTGLGLATVHGIVTQAGGTIEVESAPGDGTTVSVTLPAVSVAAFEEEALESPGRGHETIVLIEDETLVRNAVCQGLESMGYTVIAPATAEEAVLRAEAGGVDLVVSDVTMPGLSGYDVVARLARTAPELPVLLMSGYAGAEDGDGTLTFLSKPFRLADLGDAVRGLLAA